MNLPAPMAQNKPAETQGVHSRLIKCTLAPDESRAYWERTRSSDSKPSSRLAFEQYWFGARSLSWVKELMAGMRARFDAYPDALAVLQQWPLMPPQTRTAICHWHVQLTDPLYRRFTGDFLPARHEALRPDLSRRTVIGWVSERCPQHWTMATRTQFASKLLSTALAAGLVAGRRDPRQLVFPRIPDDTLTYLLYLLRDITFEGTLIDNPYLRSVGLSGAVLESRLRALPALRYRRLSDVIEYGWRYAGLSDWARVELIGKGED